MIRYEGWEVSSVDHQSIPLPSVKCMRCCAHSVWLSQLHYNEKKLPSAGADSHFFHFVALLTVNCQTGGALIPALTSSGYFKFWQECS